MATPDIAPHDDVVLPAATRDFILQALGETTDALIRMHGLRATRRLLVEEGTLLTQDNSFRINNLNQLLLMNLIRDMLAAPQQCQPGDKLDARMSPGGQSRG